jgi:RNA polymerase sigma factor (sigma-70 family)
VAIVRYRDGRDLDRQHRAIAGVSTDEGHRVNRPSPLPDAPAAPPDSWDDAEVIERSRREPEQFALVFQRHAASISRYATRRLGPGPAEDIVAETFLAAFRQRSRYDLTRRDARPWLYGIAGNLIRRHHREEVRQLRAYERTGIDPVTASFTEFVDARVSADATSRAVAAAIASLHPKQRDVLLLVAWGDLTYDQVAQTLGVAEGTVRSRMNRARTRLRNALASLDPSADDCKEYGDE